jgi:hypothetical protein
MKATDRAVRLMQTTAARYLMGLAAVALAFLARMLVAPLTRHGRPFVLFFGATLITSLFAGPGPGLGVLLVSLPLAAYLFVFRRGIFALTSDLPDPSVRRRWTPDPLLTSRMVEYAGFPGCRDCAGPIGGGLRVLSERRGKPNTLFRADR